MEKTYLYVACTLPNQFFLHTATCGVYFTLRKETNGNVVIEAIASGIPVMVPKEGAIHQHVSEGINGTIFNNRDKHPFLSALDRLLLISDRKNPRAVSDTVSHYQWKHSADILRQSVSPIIWE